MEATLVHLEQFRTMGKAVRVALKILNFHSCRFPRHVLEDESATWLLPHQVMSAMLPAFGAVESLNSMLVRKLSTNEEVETARQALCLYLSKDPKIRERVPVCVGSA